MRLTDMHDAPGPFHNHLGPNGSLDYTHSIGETMAAVWGKERVRVTHIASASEPIDEVLVVCTTDEGLVDRVFGSRVYVESYMATWDPFANVGHEAAPSWAWHGFDRDAQWSTFCTLAEARAKVDRYTEHR